MQLRDNYVLGNDLRITFPQGETQLAPQGPGEIKMKKKLWDTVKEQIAVGNPPPVFVTFAGKLALAGMGAELPESVAALYPTEIREAAHAKSAVRQAEVEAESAALRAKWKAAEQLKKSVQAKYENVRCWRLNGFYVEDSSTARYTWAEIKGWIEWDAYNLRHKQPQVSAVCERSAEEGSDFVVDISGHFDDVCNDHRSVPSFEKLATRLRDYVAERRTDKAPMN